MYTRMVEIHVNKATRDKIKSMKRELTYDQFLSKIIEEDKN